MTAQSHGLENSRPTVRRRFGRIYRDVTRRLPPTLAGAIDLSRPSFRWPTGGPLNGQQHRQSMIRQLFSIIDFSMIVETGTFRGSSTHFFREVSQAPIRTVEYDARYFTYSRLRLMSSRGVKVEHGDSREFLEELSKSADIPSQRVFFYLDAHWGADLPLREEITTIASNWTESAMLIDDFEVPDDAGYGFDDYGEGKRLCRDYLPTSDLGEFLELYPSCPSEHETGRKRGSILLLSKCFEDLLPQLTDFREISLGPHQ